MQPPRDLSADDKAIARLLDATMRRLRIADAFRAGAAGAAAAAAVVIVARTLHVRMPLTVLAAASAFLLFSVALYAVRRHRRTPGYAAARLEAAHPQLHNVIVTAAELLWNSERTPPYMRARVFADAARLSDSTSVRPAAALPLPSAWLLVSAMLLVAVSLMPFRRVNRESRPGAEAEPTPAVSLQSGDVLIEIRPPSYTALPPLQLRNPGSVEALAGSRAVITVAISSSPRIRINGVDLSLRNARGGFSAESVLTESGYMAVGATGNESQRQLIPITVKPDRAPDVRITLPAKDLRVPDGSHTIPLEATATDDLGLAALEIRYTKVSGTGEQFEFREGRLPIAMSRASGTDWRARADLALGALKMEPGDALIYRAVARDRRPEEAGTSSSETYFVEVAGPGEIALAAFEMPPDRERYLLSQAMIVLKIERLRARERTMTRAAVQDATASIAAEQRSVRANFIFLLGGEVEDEEQEAEASTEIAEGRFENSARREITLATRLMARAEQALSAASTGTALPAARDAARALQRAFGHNRYLLRALPDRTTVDPSRRLSGDMKSAADWQRALTPPSPDPLVTAARDVLRAQFAIARSLGSDPAQNGLLADRLGSLAERLLTIAPANADLQRGSREIVAARDALLRGDVPTARAALYRSVPPVLALAQRGRVDTDAATASTDRVAGALAIEARQ